VCESDASPSLRDRDMSRVHGWRAIRATCTRVVTTAAAPAVRRWSMVDLARQVRIRGPATDRVEIADSD
jgi:hypothetical protein